MATLSRWSVAFEPAVQRGAAQAERLRGVAHIAIASHGLANQEAFDVLQTHFLETRRRISAASGPQSEVGEVNHVALRHQHSPLDGMIQLADVSGPGMIDE